MRLNQWAAVLLILLCWVTALILLRRLRKQEQFLRQEKELFEMWLREKMTNELTVPVAETYESSSETLKSGLTVSNTLARKVLQTTASNTPKTSRRHRTRRSKVDSSSLTSLPLDTSLGSKKSTAITSPSSRATTSEATSPKELSTGNRRKSKDSSRIHNTLGDYSSRTRTAENEKI